jgi:hypothetical protein
MDQSPLVFLSYASPDGDRVDVFYQHLKAEGFNPWMDKYEIRGGQNWDFEIKKALKRAAIIVVFISENSVNRRGYFQREVKIALDKAQEKLLRDIYIIPIALDFDLIIPDQIEDIHVIISGRVDAFSELSRSIAGQLEELGEYQAKVEQTTGLRWSVETVSDQWDGLPGFEFKYDILKLTSPEFPEVSRITDIMRGDAAAQLLSERRAKFDQSPELFNFGQARFRRQNAMEVSCRDPIITQRFLSIVQEVYSWGAGAAHPNHGFATKNFTIDPLVLFDNIGEIFDLSEGALEVIRAQARQFLSAITYEGQQLLDEKWLMEGTDKWEHFENYAFTAEGMLILFGPYQVGPYAHGSHSVVVPYAEIAKLMKPEIAAALGVEHLMRQF